VGALALSMLLFSLGISIGSIALPTLVQAFTASFQEVQWIIIAYLLAITIMIVVAAVISIGSRALSTPPSPSGDVS
jgi:MFS family permease